VVDGLLACWLAGCGLAGFGGCHEGDHVGRVWRAGRWASNQRLGLAGAPKAGKHVRAAVGGIGRHSRAA
jgi:hypothetical protein